MVKSERYVLDVITISDSEDDQEPTATNNDVNGSNNAMWSGTTIYNVQQVHAPETECITIDDSEDESSGPEEASRPSPRPPRRRSSMEAEHRIRAHIAMATDEPYQQPVEQELRSAPSAPPVPPVDVEPSTLCIICIDARLQVLYRPCGHFIACESCDREILRISLGNNQHQTCPLCKRRIKRKHVYYF